MPALALRCDFFSARSRIARWSANFCGPESTRLTGGAVVEVVLFFFEFDLSVFGGGCATRSVTMLR